MSTDALTPMFRQYQDLKRQYPDVILLFRCGDFYELYGEDAVIGAQAMDIALTSREMRGQRMPMAGVPFHAIDRYLARLLAAGHKAALAEQMEDPKLAKGLVKRDITRIITPGTVVEDYLLDERSNNYLLALHTEHGYGLAIADCSTGEFQVTEVTVAERAREKIFEEIARLQPSEILLPSATTEDPSLLEELRARCNARHHHAGSQRICLGNGDRHAHQTFRRQPRCAVSAAKRCHWRSKRRACCCAICSRRKRPPSGKSAV